MSDSLHAVCPHCEAINRLAPARLTEAPKCGQCHAPLFDARPVELSTAKFRTHVQRNDIPLLVDFWAPWCAPCRVMGPQFAEAAATLEPRVRLAKVNTEAEQALAGEFGIRSIPTMILFKGGREVARQSGSIGAADIVRWTQSRLTPAQ
jgi:thioredoxin 2